MIRGAIFDLDGTLLDSMALWAHLGERYLQSIGVQPRESLPRRLQSMSLPEAISYFQTGYGLQLSEAEILSGIRALVADAYYHTLPLKPGVLPFLEFLRAHDVSMYLATANDRDLVEAVLDRCGIRSFFAGSITCEEAGSSKRQPGIYEKALEGLGTRREETAVFEDTTHAAETAKKAGFLLAGVYDSHERQPEYLRELSDYYIADFMDTSSFSQFL